MTFIVDWSLHTAVLVALFVAIGRYIIFPRLPFFVSKLFLGAAMLANGFLPPYHELSAFQR